MDKNFVRMKFVEKYCDYKNFFNDVLEPLFIYSLLIYLKIIIQIIDTKVPFLNGGLFDPIKNYNWLNSNFHI